MLDNAGSLAHIGNVIFSAEVEGFNVPGCINPDSSYQRDRVLPGYKLVSLDGV
jgi:hypothetical protein